MNFCNAASLPNASHGRTIASQSYCPYEDYFLASSTFPNIASAKWIRPDSPVLLASIALLCECARNTDWGLVSFHQAEGRQDRLVCSLGAIGWIRGNGSKYSVVQTRVRGGGIPHAKKKASRAGPEVLWRHTLLLNNRHHIPHPWLQWAPSVSIYCQVPPRGRLNGRVSDTVSVGMDFLFWHLGNSSAMIVHQ